MNNFLQFELWKDCNNKCTFCFNNNAATSADVKYTRISFIRDELKNPKYKSITKVGFVGGEFFDKQMDSALFYEFMLTIAHAYMLPSVKQVLVTSSLLFEDLSQLITMCKLFNTDGKLLICTSWDTEGRFHTPRHNLLWNKNISKLHKILPYQEIHVEIIPTQAHILSVLADKFNINTFKSTFKVNVDYCTPCSGLVYKDKYDFDAHIPNFFPKRADFLRFLHKVYTEGQATPDMFTNYNNMSTILWMEVNGKYQCIEGYRGPLDGKTVDHDYPLPPMHENTSDYIDSHNRMRKDVLDVWENIYG